jgi:glutathione S-transferase
VAGALEADELGDILEVLSEHELFALGDDGNIAHAELEQALAASRIIQYINGDEIDLFARKKLFRPETAASPRLGEQDELFVGAHMRPFCRQLKGGARLTFPGIGRQGWRCYNPRAFFEPFFFPQTIHMMKLIGTVTSPYTRKVRVALAEKRMECEFIVDSPNTPDSVIARYNPLGKIPVLVLDDDNTIFDSRVIVEHLDNATPGNRLIPAEKRPRILVRRWEALADGCTDAAIALVNEKKKPAAQQSPEWITRQQGKVDRALQAMADDLAARPWCAGDFFTLADIAVGCCLGWLELRLPDLPWRRSYPNLARLADKLAQRQSFRDTAA